MGKQIETNEYTMLQLGNRLWIISISTLDEAKFPTDGAYSLSTSLTNSIGIETPKSDPIIILIDTVADIISYSISNGKIVLSGANENSEVVYRSDESSRWLNAGYNNADKTLSISGTHTNLEIKTYDANGLESNVITIASFVGA